VLEVALFLLDKLTAMLSFSMLFDIMPFLSLSLRHAPDFLIIDLARYLSNNSEIMVVVTVIQNTV